VIWFLRRFYRGWLHGATPFVVCLIVINVSVIGIANKQASLSSTNARSRRYLQNESRYTCIGFIVLTMLQSWMAG
jgi:hypothetical protein